jgi:hypothetical protein
MIWDFVHFTISFHASKQFQEPNIVDADAKLRAERHLCSQHATYQPSPVGAAYSANHNILTGVVHSFSMSLLTELSF